ncbi:MAG: hypothetical protein AB7V62_04070 [Thermoleophilia bacterium]
MRAARAAACALLAAAALAAAGCGGGGDPAPAPDPEPPPEGPGLFVGTGPGGIGATLDLEGSDAVSEAVAEALRPADGGAAPVVGIASVVNDGPRAFPAPSFVGLLENGGAAPLLPAAEEVAERLPAEAARRAEAALGAAPLTVPAGGARTMYVVLRGVEPGEVVSARMVVVPGSPITMSARRR